MSEHTPGPWSVCDGDGKWIVETPEFGIIITAEGGNSDADLANARLVAAAPELLEACRDALRSMEHLTAGGVTHPTVLILRAAIERASK